VKHFNRFSTVSSNTCCKLTKSKLLPMSNSRPMAPFSYVVVFHAKSLTTDRVRTLNCVFVSFLFIAIAVLLQFCAVVVCCCCCRLPQSVRRSSEPTLSASAPDTREAAKKRPKRRFKCLTSNCTCQVRHRDRVATTYRRDARQALARLARVRSAEEASDESRSAGQVTASDRRDSQKTSAAH
jgi:hypothetical protein